MRNCGKDTIRNLQKYCKSETKMRLEQWEIWYKKVTDTKGMVDIEEFNLMTELKFTR